VTAVKPARAAPACNRAMDLPDVWLPAAGDALVVVDVQNDFLPGGALGVPAGDRVLAPLNHCLDAFAARHLPVFATRDWHPPDHCSFRPQGGPWPPHCVAGTDGAAFPAVLRLPPAAHVVSKARGAQEEAYSGFAGTGLEALLHAAGAHRLVVGGLATDYCVLRTVEDALARGFVVLLLRDAIAPVEAKPGDGARALARMQVAGAVPVDSDAVAA
jgi:nicotinamidase/pyrazinamidase